jgi:hypothetical protein
LPRFLQLLNQKPPHIADPKGERYVFEKGATKTTGGDANIPAAEYVDDPRAVVIAGVAQRLNELREAWLSPLNFVKRIAEVVPGYPDRIVPVSPKSRLDPQEPHVDQSHNECPVWLDNADRDPRTAALRAFRGDAALAAYGWLAHTSEEEALARLLNLNSERAAAGR